MNTNIRRGSLGSVCALAILAFGSSASAFSGTWWTNWNSEENQPAMCADDTVATRMECRGGNCDDVRFSCTNAPRDLWGHTWTDYKSEEVGYNNCPTNYFVTGVHCHGNNCDDLALQCTQMVGAAQSNCQWVGSFSEEAPVNYGQCPANKFIQGIFCSGSNCDNLWVYCCNM
jgi:hypothetical protein